MASPESWSRPAERGEVALLAGVAIALFLLSWSLLHVGFWERDQVIDIPVYQTYGDAIARGKVPYRDFRLEYPPGALPAFAVPAIGDDAHYRARFEWLMLLCGTTMVGLMAATLAALGAGLARVIAALLLAGLAPVALGSVMLTRFDLWPAALTVAAVGALAAGRHRLGAGVLGFAVAVKIYPLVLVPLALTWIARRRGRREALVCAAVFGGVLAACFAPFLVVAPEGVVASIGRQVSRPLQIESLGSALLLGAHHVFGAGLEMKSSHGSQNVAGAPGVVVGIAQTAVQAIALLAIWIGFARGRDADRERFVLACAAAVCAFVALGKVLSPQFLIWLIPLVPLVRGLRGLLASALLAAALVLTQLWFPYRYWRLALEFDELASWLVLARDLTLVGLVIVLASPLVRTRARG